MPARGSTGTFGLAKLKAGLAQGIANLRRPPRGIQTTLGVHLNVAQLEFLEAAFGFRQLGLVTLDLLLNETARTVRILARCAQTGFDKNSQQSLHDTLGHLRIRVPVGQGVKVVSPRGLDADGFGHSVNYCIFRCFGLCTQIKVNNPNQALHGRSADKGAAEHGHLLLNIRLHRNPRHKGAQDGLGIDKYAC